MSNTTTILDSHKDILPGTFVRIRSKNWVVEQSGKIGSIRFVDLISVEDDAQGEALRVTLSSEVDQQVIDPNDWSALFQTKFESPERLGAFLRATEWRTSSAADRKLFQAPFRAGIRLDAYQLLPLAVFKHGMLTPLAG
ncbi:hypothetical protein [Rhizobium nepotum]|uniref:ASCH domain-containing protein n=1 Tax=Rhizobium nepotum 39/7 TaxID=1368418 RepID=A0ABR5CS93_9HYPH|nr:hypothetical protein [Rhizobium nepotum]KJF67599.1 hypothetical protein RS75_10865 [Rhizobium nepotum 39/7]